MKARVGACVLDISPPEAVGSRHVESGILALGRGES